SDVSKMPPWSIATSTTTEPSGICFTISSVTNFGALAPGISTAPTTKSDSFTASAMVNGDDIIVCTEEPNSTSISRSLSGFKSNIVTSAPNRSEEHTSELQSRFYFVCILLLEIKKLTYTLYVLISIV